jgi:quercetin dioxygenase-like cupin family protein
MAMEPNIKHDNMRTNIYLFNRICIAGILVLLICGTASISAEIKPKERNILFSEAQAISLDKVLITGNSWIDLPDYNNRTFWNNLPENIRNEYIAKAEKYLSYDWPVVKATDYLEFIRSGDRRQQVYAACSNALNSLVMGELTEGKGRFIDQIINAVWYYSEQTWWGWSAHLGTQKAGAGLPDITDPFVDLGVGEIANDLSWTYYLFHQEFDRIHPLISARLKMEITNKVLVPYLTRDDFWYMGFTGGRPNNWNPWINYNMLNSFMLIEDDPAKKREAVDKIVRSLDKFLNGYSDDGGCDEGPSYWGAAGALLYESLELLGKATGGSFNVFDNTLVQNIGKYFYRANIHVPYFINFADADATTMGNASAVYRYGKAIKDSIMQQFGAYLARLGNFGEHSFGGRICDQIKNLTLMNEITHAAAKEALVADFWLPETEIAGARDMQGSYSGFFFGAKGGFNDESHNHNDVGSCVMYFDGKPCIIDLGREEYNAKTFSPRRYEIWTMQSGYHNLPVINGTDQKEGKNFKALNTTFHADSRKAVFSTDIAGAYPAGAMVKRWLRSYTLNRGKSFIIKDRYELTGTGKEPTSSNFMTYCRVTKIRDGLLRLDGDGFSIEMSYDPRKADPIIEYIEVKDRTLKRYWPKGVTRIRMQFLNPGLNGDQSFTFRPVKTNGVPVADVTAAPAKRISEEKIIHEVVAPGRERTVVHLDSLMVVVFDFTGGAMKEPDPFHSHPHEQITYVADGEVLYFRGDDRLRLKKGDLITIAPGVPHCIQTLSSDTRLIDSFYPLRNDFLTSK